MAIRTKNPKIAKTKAIESISNDVKAASSYIFTEYRGLTVQQITALRRKLAENNCTYKVVRNNFARAAFQELNVEEINEYFVGPTALAYVTEDANTAAKTLFDFAKEAPALIVKCAVVDGEFYDAEKIEAYSKLPGKKELISMFMSTLNATTSKFVRTLQAIVDKGEVKTEEKAEAKEDQPAEAKSEEKPAEEKTAEEKPAEDATEAEN